LLFLYWGHNPFINMSC